MTLLSNAVQPNKRLVRTRVSKALFFGVCARRTAGTLYVREIRGNSEWLSLNAAGAERKYRTKLLRALVVVCQLLNQHQLLPKRKEKRLLSLGLR